MAYSSFDFMIFVIAVFVIYFTFPAKKQRWIILLISSMVFYLYAGYRFVIFILLTMFSSFIVALWLEKISENTKQIIQANKTSWNREQKKEFKNQMKRKKQLLITSVLILNFGILGFLKYYNFFSGSLNDIIHGFKISFSVPTLRLFLPIGISFYTFQTMGYVIDIYREKYKAEKNIFKYALFVSFFPQIIQGPIGTYDHLANQLYEPHQFDFNRFKHGMELVLWGYFKKVVIADRAVILINSVTDDYIIYNGTIILLSVLFYSFQLYADFSGGIDISRGIAQVFGIDMTENFRRPYFSKSISEYWRRWHITLGAWMREYLFYPIAMSNTFLGIGKKIKKSKYASTKLGIHLAKVLPTAITSWIVFMVVGIWHGAEWRYVAFGFWNGSVIFLSTLLKPCFELLKIKFGINDKTRGFILFQIIRTFIIVLIGYVFDIAPTLFASCVMFKKMLFEQNVIGAFSELYQLGLNKYDYLVLMFGVVIMFIVSIIQEHNRECGVRLILDSKPFILRFGLILVCILMILVCGIYGPGYNAADFIYMQF